MHLTKHSLRRGKEGTPFFNYLPFCKLAIIAKKYFKGFGWIDQFKENWLEFHTSKSGLRNNNAFCEH